MTTDTVKVTFTQIDDNVNIYVNEKSVISHNGPLRSNDPQLVVDITKHLQQGENDLRIEAENEPGSATLVGKIEKNDSPVYPILYPTQHPGKGVFYNETFKIDFDAGQVGHPPAIDVILSIIQVFDSSAAWLNENQIDNTNMLAHKDGPKTISIMSKGHHELMQEGENTLKIKANNDNLGFGCFWANLIGIGADGSEFIIREWRVGPSHTLKDMDYVNESLQFQYNSDEGTVIFPL